MRQLGQQPEGAGTKETGLGRRSFLRRAGMAAAVVGGLEAIGMTSAMAATSRKGSRKIVGAAYPSVGKPGLHTKSIVVKPDCSCDITWFCTPGDCGGPCPHPEWCYFWHDSCNNTTGGPVCAWSSCSTHVQCE